MKDIDKQLDEILELYGLKAIASIDDKGLDNAKASTKQAIKQLINQARRDELIWATGGILEYTDEGKKVIPARIEELKGE